MARTPYALEPAPAGVPLLTVTRSKDSVLDWAKTPVAFVPPEPLIVRSESVAPEVVELAMTDPFTVEVPDRDANPGA